MVTFLAEGTYASAVISDDLVRYLRKKGFGPPKIENEIIRQERPPKHSGDIHRIVVFRYSNLPIPDDVIDVTLRSAELDEDEFYDDVGKDKDRSVGRSGEEDEDAGQDVD